MAKARRTTSVGWREDRTRRFQILVSGNFTCAYCGCMPGADRLHVDHLVPVSKGGSNDPANLCCACDTCNTRKSDAIIFPPSMVIGKDADGFDIHRVFGEWTIAFDETRIVAQRRTYWFELQRLYNAYFEQHLYCKFNDKPHWLDFCDCCEYAMRLVADPL